MSIVIFSPVSKFGDQSLRSSLKKIAAMHGATRTKVQSLLLKTDLRRYKKLVKRLNLELHFVV